MCTTSMRLIKMRGYFIFERINIIYHQDSFRHDDMESISSDTTLPVSIVSVERDEKGVGYRAIVIDGHIEDGTSRFWFPARWRGYEKWGEIQRERFERLVRPDSTVNITFDNASHVLLEITATTENDYSQFLIIADDLDDYFPASSSLSPPPPQEPRPALLKTKPPSSTTTTTTTFVSSQMATGPMRVKIVLESPDGNTCYLKRPPMDDERVRVATRLYLHTLSTLFPTDKSYRAMLNEL